MPAWCRSVIRRHLIEKGSRRIPVPCTYPLHAGRGLLLPAPGPPPPDPGDHAAGRGREKSVSE